MRPDRKKVKFMFAPKIEEEVNEVKEEVNELKQEVNEVNEVKLTRSNSMGGLASLSKSVCKQQETLDELNLIIEHLKEIITKYENEIKELQKDNKERDVLIKQYELKYSQVEKSINDIWNS